MPKQAKSSKAKVKQICQEYPDEFLSTLAGDLRCNLCNVLVKCEKKFFCEKPEKATPRKIGDEKQIQKYANLFTTK